MFADFPSTDFINKIRDRTVKDHQFHQYKAKPDLLINLTKDLSTLSLEEHQPCIRTGPLTAGQAT